MEPLVLLFRVSRGQNVLCQFDNGALHPVWLVTEVEQHSVPRGLPLRYAYGTTIEKMQGQTLHSLAVVPDYNVIAAAHVTVTRIRKLSQLFWITRPGKPFFVPLRSH